MRYPIMNWSHVRNANQLNELPRRRRHERIPTAAEHIGNPRPAGPRWDFTAQTQGHKSSLRAAIAVNHPRRFYQDQDDFVHFDIDPTNSRSPPLSFGVFLLVSLSFLVSPLPQLYVTDSSVFVSDSGVNDTRHQVTPKLIVSIFTVPITFIKNKTQLKSDTNSWRILAW